MLSALLALGLVGSVLAVGLHLSKPAVAIIGAPPAALAGGADVAIPSASGALLRGWWLPGAQGGGAVVLMHGVRANRLQMVERAQFLHQHGFGVLLFDFQAHGESSGRRITYGHLEALDAIAAVAFVRERQPGERVGVIGVSLGGAASLLGPAPLAVDALVLESVYPDIDAALSNRLTAALGPVAGAVFPPILSPIFGTLLPPIIGVRPSELRPIDRIGGIHEPLLLASGTIDDRTPLTEAQALFARAPEPRRFWAVPGAAHVDLENFNPAAYWQHILPFLVEKLQSNTSVRP